MPMMYWFIKVDSFSPRVIKEENADFHLSERSLFRIQTGAVAKAQAFTEDQGVYN